VAGWRLGALPRGLERRQVQALLACCDTGSAVGLRDHAILTVLARLGLRGAEVAALGLGDLDWRAGEIVVRGKGARVERLPLPAEVGAALAAYLTGGRPSCGCATLFVTALAEVGQVLRHRSQLATAIYAKVDHQTLRTLARPWPGSPR
jgi:site-specific recombinase XerC